MESEPWDALRATSLRMGARGLWSLLPAILAVACAADPGDGPKDDAGEVASSDAGPGGSSGGSGGGSSGATTAPPPGDDTMDATLPPAGDGASTAALEASAPPPPPPPSCTTCPLTVEYFSDTRPDMSSVKFHVSISNNGSMPQALSDLTLRYWFTADGITSFTPHMYYAAQSTITTSTAAESFTTLTATSTPPATATADTYMQVSFTQGAGSIAAMSSTDDIQLEFNDSTYQGTQNESNDYSHTASDTQANCEGQNNALTCQTMTITLYRSGTLVWGIEPGGAQAPGDAGSQPPADQ
jgi:Cellulose binding domain